MKIEGVVVKVCRHDLMMRLAIGEETGVWIDQGEADTIEL